MILKLEPVAAEKMVSPPAKIEEAHCPSTIKLEDVSSSSNKSHVEKSPNSPLFNLAKIDMEACSPISR